MALNKPETAHIIVGCISSVIVGCSLPAFAVLFGSVYAVSSRHVTSQRFTDIKQIYRGNKIDIHRPGVLLKYRNLFLNFLVSSLVLSHCDHLYVMRV